MRPEEEKKQSRSAVPWETRAHDTYDIPFAKSGRYPVSQRYVPQVYIPDRADGDEVAHSPARYLNHRTLCIASGNA